jgi:hypothetical protein
MSMISRYFSYCALLATVACSSGEAGTVGAKNDNAPPERDARATTESDDPHGPLEEDLARSRHEFAGTFGEPLPELAAKCDAATGIHVPDFNCANGTEVPISHFANGRCDRPNRLNKECDPGSRFQIVAQTSSAVAVAHCRQRQAVYGNSGNTFADVAVIQYNKVNGAICFYQALEPHMDGNFKAPARGSSLPSEAAAPDPNASPWLSSLTTKNIRCAGCHDNGGFIRSPYLAQIPFMPGAGDNSFNRDQPVSFIGTDFEPWQTFSVRVTGNLCINCHRQGTNLINPGAGTGRDLALRATATSETSKNPHSPDSPIWMPPNQIFYSASNETQARNIANCATAWGNNTALPSGCSVSPLSTPYRGITPAVIGHMAAVVEM